MEEELNLKEIVDIFKTKISLIIIIILSVTFIGLIYITFIQKPMYQADTTLVLTVTSTDKSITQNDVTLNSKLVSTYSEIVKSRKIASDVISKLGLNISEDTLINMITVSSKKDTEMIDINVKNADAIVAAQIANSLAEVFSKQIVSIYNIQNVSIIDTAKPNNVPYNINIMKQLAIFVFIGIVIACSVVFLIYYFDTTVKSAEEIEKKLGLPVLAVIPIDSNL